MFTFEPLNTYNKKKIKENPLYPWLYTFAAWLYIIRYDQSTSFQYFGDYIDYLMACDRFYDQKSTFWEDDHD